MLLRAEPFLFRRPFLLPNPLGVGIEHPKPEGRTVLAAEFDDLLFAVFFGQKLPETDAVKILGLPARPVVLGPRHLVEMKETIFQDIGPQEHLGERGAPA